MELEERIQKVKTTKLLFIIFGIVCLVIGITIPFVIGWYLGVEAANKNAENVIAYIFSQPFYYVFTIISTLLINGGIALLLIQAIYLKIKLRNLMEEKRAKENG